ncbi:TPA: IS1595-like element ISNme2 family transposase, partial [Neisseria meningitidis]
RRIRGKRGRGASGKTIVFGILKRNGVVYTEIVPDASKASLIKVIRGHISADSEINTDGWKAYDGLVDMGYEKHYRVHHGSNEFARGKQHINGI